MTQLLGQVDMMLDTRLMLTTICFAALFTGLSGCHDDSSSMATSGNAAVSDSTPPAASTSITGTPVATATVGSAYAFIPVVKADAAAELS
ncbi:MAG: hypothetical protein QOF42_3752, partial [Gammaproteobacteria bacterium]|nr:hypothetical protein [Gammaproteobacteria bacterium]